MTTLLILGASGDLTERLLLPGLGSLIGGGVDADRELISGLRILGSGRSPRTREEWQKSVAAAFEGVSATGADARTIIESAEYVQGDPTSKDDLTNKWRGK